MTTDLAVHQPTTALSEEMRYAEALCFQPERGAQSLLPAAYRGNPANVLIAIGLGKAIGITPAQALYEIYVVNGRPSPSANLMAALVRRAGHKLRIDTSADSATATLIRSDDPEFPFRATWTLDQARRAGLANKDTWKSYPAAMLRARAISEVVRMGAPEAVIGMDYSAEEMGDLAGHQQPTAPFEAQPRPTVASIVTPQTDAGATAPVEPAVALVDTAPEQGPRNPAPASGPDPDPEPDWTRPLITAGQQKALHAGLKEIGITDRELGLEYCAAVIGHPVESTKDLTKDEAGAVIDRLKSDADR